MFTIKLSHIYDVELGHGYVHDSNKAKLKTLKIIDETGRLLNEGL